MTLVIIFHLVFVVVYTVLHYLYSYITCPKNRLGNFSENWNIGYSVDFAFTAHIAIFSVYNNYNIAIVIYLQNIYNITIVVL